MDKTKLCVCLVDRCVPLPEGIHSTPDTFATGWNTIANYTCDVGHEPVSGWVEPFSTRCPPDNNGVWTQMDVLQCTRKLLECGNSS